MQSQAHTNWSSILAPFLLCNKCPLPRSPFTCPTMILARYPPTLWNTCFPQMWPALLSPVVLIILYPQPHMPFTAFSKWNSTQASRPSSSVNSSRNSSLSPLISFNRCLRELPALCLQLHMVVLYFSVLEYYYPYTECKVRCTYVTCMNYKLLEGRKRVLCIFSAVNSGWDLVNVSWMNTQVHENIFRGSKFLPEQNTNHLFQLLK